jgi:hypothetical protein
MASTPYPTLGNDQAAIATLLSALSLTQAAVTNAEVNLIYLQPVTFGIRGATDQLFNALLCPNVIGRLQSEDALHPSAILLNRVTAGGQPCVQVAFATVLQASLFVAASNYILTLPSPDLGREVVACQLYPQLRAAGTAGNTFSGDQPLMAVNGRATIVINTLSAQGAAAPIAGAGTVAVATAQKVAGRTNVNGAGTVTVNTLTNQAGVGNFAGAGHVTESATVSH